MGPKRFLAQPRFVLFFGVAVHPLHQHWLPHGDEGAAGKTSPSPVDEDVAARAAVDAEGVDGPVRVVVAHDRDLALLLLISPAAAQTQQRRQR